MPKNIGKAVEFERWDNHQGWYWVILLAVFLGALMLLFFVNVQFAEDYRNSQSTVSVISKERSVLIRVLIDFGQSMRAFEGEARAGMTMEKALREIAEVGKLDLEIQKGVVSRLGNQKSGREKTWNIYVNDASLLGLIYELKGGDRVAIRYE